MAALRCLPSHLLVARPLCSALERGISGGQAKRVNIGIALISNPRVLFLGEQSWPVFQVQVWRLLFFPVKAASSMPCR